MQKAPHTAALEEAFSPWIGAVGLGIEVLGVGVIVAGLAWSLLRLVPDARAGRGIEGCRVRIGRSLLLGLEIVVAADIVKTVAFDLTPRGLALLAGLILLRTFLSWTLVLEIEGRWPWQRRACDDGGR